MQTPGPSYQANVAQLVEQLTRNEQVSGSSPLIGSTLLKRKAPLPTPGAALFKFGRRRARQRSREGFRRAFRNRGGIKCASQQTVDRLEISNPIHFSPDQVVDVRPRKYHFKEPPMPPMIAPPGRPRGLFHPNHLARSHGRAGGQPRDIQPTHQ
jgi:hypothetical protein